MISLTRILVEPLYRLIFGRPIDDALPALLDHSAHAPAADAASGKGTEEPESRRRGLVLVVGGVGGFELLGTTLRFVLPAAGLNYAIHLLPWGHGFGRWHADLTNVANRDHQGGRACRHGPTIPCPAARRLPLFLIAKSGGCRRGRQGPGAARAGFRGTRHLAGACPLARGMT